MKKFKIKKWKIVTAVLVVVSLIGLTVLLTLGGSKQSEVLAQGSQTVPVQRGNLRLEITAAGNLALAHTEDLAIELFYGQSGSSGTKGTIGEVLVKEGDTVEEGQVLVTLDQDEWDKQLKAVEKAVATAQRNLTAKESAVTDAEHNVTTLERQVTAKEKAVAEAERQVTAKEFAVRQAEVDMQTAEYNLSQIKEVKKVQDRIDNAEDYLRLIRLVRMGELGGGLQGDFSYWSQQEAMAKDELAELQQDLQDILDDNNMTLSDDVKLQVAKYQLLVTKSQMALEDAQIAVDAANQAVADAQIAVDDAIYTVKKARLSLENAKLDLEDARQTVADAQSDLDDAKNLSPVITAPFAGFVTKVNVAGGDEVLKGTVAVQIADPNKFEAEILVSELDISQVKLGGEAAVQVDATGLSLPATVTHIAPTATIQSGVVNYRVTVEVQSIPDDANLREGMTVTVSLIVAERQNVLLVPYAAITTDGGQKYVQVVSSTGTTEKRAIQTGITDYQFTEVIEGLSEGEQIVVSQGTITKSTTTTTQQQPQGGIIIPGVGGPPAGGGPR